MSNLDPLKPLYTISIIGYGNVAQQLIAAFSAIKTIKIVQLLVRNHNKTTISHNQIEIISEMHQLKPVDLMFIAVTDDAIASVSEQIPIENQLVAHTSGTVSINKLANHLQKAVFYPLQSISNNIKMNFKNVPICLETKDESKMDLLKHIAQKISDKTVTIDSKQRNTLHIAAVFANNFTNLMYDIAHEICKDNNIPFSILKPLIQETALKINDLNPKEAQTGPAKRKDFETIENHINMLQNDTYRKIYQILTQTIIANA
ncbi:hypothetical protein B0A58_06710 [Flavobacterium branchiophilum NBRC 15030 = ATCC 35035]|uniref:Uncharacterized protein DUF2520 n=1 Tax=Flavobacterium branchiophilum TaxID=55197 RepID=A0A543G7Y8_9FLAO|nr:DUF2520 domain-containing protein [Flavobacterium branchiophilum]OXA76944.1 hypothetical protein B0A58_06710 [Flavobacterium branchiophilum NBRC 15030 = ATCC 35035]TQM42197.1 uncharacterized protein DUF2520 [Flavobacterium branchiophilum]GEM54508.1 hypothetical protein FB1_07290 [Flavobacterium branchiophilum NBRC 15030 = ATCC 35035]